MGSVKIRSQFMTSELVLNNIVFVLLSSRQNYLEFLYVFVHQISLFPQSGWVGVTHASYFTSCCCLCFSDKKSGI